VENGTEDANYKMDDNNENTSFPESTGDGSKENVNSTSVTLSYRVVEHKLVQQKNVTEKEYSNAYSGNIVRNKRANYMEEALSRNYTKYSENMSGKSEQNVSTNTSSNFVYKTDMPVAAYPSTMGNSGLYATTYVRGLHIDLLSQGTDALHAGNGVQLQGRTDVKGAQTGGTDLKRGNHWSSKQQ
jgi:hypothetical protein